MRLNLGDRQYERRGILYGPGVVEIMDLHEAKQIAAVMRSEDLDPFAPVPIHEEIARAGQVMVLEEKVPTEPAQPVTPPLPPAVEVKKAEAAKGKPGKVGG